MNKQEFYKLIPKSELLAFFDGRKFPVFCYFKKIIEKKYRDLSDCLPEQFKIHYAFKANPNKDILKTMNALGMGADVASGGELAAALDAGFSPDTIEFTGPGKTLDELSLAIDSGISCINVESISEIKKITELTRSRRKTANIGIRINPKTRPTSSAMKMGGDTQFGIPEDQLEEAIAVIKSHSEILRFRGLHLHLGSQYQESDKILSNYRFILQKSVEIAHKYGIVIEKINFGGGWGIDMFGKKPPLDLAALKESLSGLLADEELMASFRNTTFIIEPGRFLVAECGIYAVEVLYCKKSYAREFLVVDGGMHQQYAAAGGIGQVIRRNYEIDILSEKEESGTKSKYTITGSLCIPDDVLATDVELHADIKEGDVVLFFNSGAYGFSASPLHFLSHALPAEIVV